jgi:hypothetical protein
MQSAAITMATAQIPEVVAGASLIRMVESVTIVLIVNSKPAINLADH